MPCVVSRDNRNQWPALKTQTPTNVSVEQGDYGKIHGNEEAGFGKLLNQLGTGPLHHVHNDNLPEPLSKTTGQDFINGDKEEVYTDGHNFDQIASPLPPTPSKDSEDPPRAVSSCPQVEDSTETSPVIVVQHNAGNSFVQFPAIPLESKETNAQRTVSSCPQVEDSTETSPAIVFQQNAGNSFAQPPAIPLECEGPPPNNDKITDADIAEKIPAIEQNNICLPSNSFAQPPAIPDESEGPPPNNDKIVNAGIAEKIPAIEQNNIDLPSNSFAAQPPACLDDSKGPLTNNDKITDADNIAKKIPSLERNNIPSNAFAQPPAIPPESEGPLTNSNKITDADNIAEKIHAIEQNSIPSNLFTQPPAIPDESEGPPPNSGKFAEVARQEPLVTPCDLDDPKETNAQRTVSSCPQVEDSTETSPASVVQQNAINSFAQPPTIPLESEGPPPNNNKITDADISEKIPAIEQNNIGLPINSFAHPPATSDESKGSLTKKKKVPTATLR